MSENDNSVERLAGTILEQQAVVRKFITNQNEVLVALKTLVEKHSQVLNAHQEIIEALAHKMGVPLGSESPDDAPPTPSLN